MAIRANQLRIYGYEDWIKEANDLFGTDRRNWKFICPVCGHVAAVADFLPFEEKGATPESALFNCIGRYAGCKRKAFDKGDPAAPGPCDYSSGGIFDLRPVAIIMDDGSILRAFDFVRAESPGEPHD
ncbi:MAG: VVA0879 family protein [Candidatus Omnitrophota bacterium]|jgi:hypothetical protein